MTGSEQGLGLNEGPQSKGYGTWEGGQDLANFW